MQKDNQNFTPVTVTSPAAMAKKFNITKDFIIALCENNLLETNNNQTYEILENQTLPCVLEFKDAANNANNSILNGDYTSIDLEKIYIWTKCLLNDYHNVEFTKICINKGVFQDAQGYLHFKFIIEAMEYLKASSWNYPIDKIFKDVDCAIPSASRVLGVFDTETEAYVYASKMYSKIHLKDKIKLKYLELFFFNAGFMI